MWRGFWISTKSIETNPCLHDGPCSGSIKKSGDRLGRLSTPSRTQTHRAYRNWLAREAGYPSYVDLQHRVRRTARPADAGHERSASIEDAAALTILGKPGVPPRQARKGGEPGSIDVQEESTDWLRLTLTRPEAVDFGAVTTALTPHLARDPLTLRIGDADAHRRIFDVQDLRRKGWQTADIAARLKLDDDATSWGQDRVIELKKAYHYLVRRLQLPPVAAN